MPLWRSIRRVRQPLLLSGLVVLALLASGCSRCSEDRKAKKTAAAKADKKASAKATAAKKKPAPNVVEKVPHPDFPTAAMARTDDIFLLEEPDRGPLVTQFSLPATGALQWTTHGWCELDYDDVICGAAIPDDERVRAHWRIGRRAERLLIATRRFGPRVDETIYFDRVANGQVIRIMVLNRYESLYKARYFDAGGERYTSRKATGANALGGCGQMQLERDKEGKVQAVTCLQWSGAPMVDANGVTITRLTRGEHGLIRKRERLDRDRKPVDGHDGVHRLVYERDPQGRVVRRRAFDKAGFPVLSQSDGCHGLSQRWGPRGLMHRRTCLDAEERPTKDKDGSCRHEFEYDGRGCLVGKQYLKPGASRGSCRRKHKRHDYVVDHRCARQSKICRNGKGDRDACGMKEPAEMRYSRDDRGRVVSIKYFAIDEQPAGDAACRSFETRKTWDERGRLLTVGYHGPDGGPVECARTGYQGLRYERDDADRVIRQRFVAVDGTPGTNLGCAVRHFRHDNYDHVVETRNHGIDGKLVDVLGLAIKRYLYDEGHRDFAKLLFDVDDRPARYTGCFTGQQCPGQTWHALRVRRTANGKVASNVYFDHDGQLKATLDCSKKRCWGD